MKVKKPNPQIRWHLSAAEKKRIAELSSRGVNQTSIGHALGITRNSVCLALKKLNLPTRVPLLHRDEILELLRQGIGSRRIGQKLKVSHRKVLAFARENGFCKPPKPPLSAAQRERLVADIRNHTNSALSLAKKYNRPYKEVLALAHSTLQCEKFLPIWKFPLSSYYPQTSDQVTYGQTRRYPPDLSA